MRTNPERTDERAPSSAVYTKEGMRQALAAITSDPKHVRINAERLEQVAARIPTSIASGWVAKYQDTDEHYQGNLPPLPVDLNPMPQESSLRMASNRLRRLRLARRPGFRKA